MRTTGPTGVVYAVFCHRRPDKGMYVGSTKHTAVQRLQQHIRQTADLALRGEHLCPFKRMLWSCSYRELKALMVVPLEYRQRLQIASSPRRRAAWRCSGLRVCGRSPPSTPAA